MADNIGYTPGAGATIAADDIGGVLHQRVKIGIGADGAATDISTSNPMPITAPNAITTTESGELVEAIQALRMAINTLTKTVGFALPNTLGQPIIEARQATAGNLNATVSITGTPSVNVTTLTTLSNQTNIGGFNAADKIPALMCAAAQGLRRNISVT